MHVDLKLLFLTEQLVQTFVAAYWPFGGEMWLGLSLFRQQD